MTYFKKTLLWIIVMVAVVGASYLDFEKTRIDEKERDEATRLFPFDAVNILALTLEKEGRILELERWDDGWRIVSPITTDADDKAVETFLGYVLDSRNDADYVLDPDPTPERLAEFGLVKPRSRVTIKVGRELTPYTLTFGDRAPTMGVAFAQLEGDKAVYRVLADAQAEADKDAYYFRDKRALKIDPVAIDQLSVKWDGGNVLVKMPDNGRWTIEKPVKAAADHVRVFELLAAFTSTEIKEFTDLPVDADPAFGLTDPKAVMLIWAEGDGEPTIRLAIGARDPAKRGYYCSVTGHEGVIVLSEESVNALPRKASDLRNRELFAIDESLLRRIEIKNANSVVTLVLDKDKDWRKGGDQGEKVDFQRVKEFTDQLIQVRIVDFVENRNISFSEYGLSPPLMEVALWLDGEKEPHRLKVGHQDPTGALRYGRTGDEAILLERGIVQTLTTYF